MLQAPREAHVHPRTGGMGREGGPAGASLGGGGLIGLSLVGKKAKNVSKSKAPSRNTSWGGSLGDLAG